ncbi:outer membrane beta-barrel protein [Flavitalea antarctica]
MRSLIILLLLKCTMLNAQTITGHVMSEDNSPVTNASISMLRASDSFLLKIVMTDREGKFVIDKVEAPQLLIYVTAIGYQPVYRALVTTSIEIRLVRLPVGLTQVVVTARKPLIEIKPDKLVFNVEGSINASGSNALELLQKAPGTLVDKDDNIILAGKNGVRIHIDGKPTPLTGTDLASYLRSINSYDIEAIEIITNPSSRYDAAGNAGIINIRLKKNTNLGWNGSFSGGYSIGIYAKYTVGASLNYRNKRVNFFSNYSISANTNRSQLNFFRVQNDTIYDQVSSGISEAGVINLKTGLDIFISKKQTFGILVNSGLGNTEYAGNSITAIEGIGTLAGGQRLTATGLNRARRTNVSANLNYKYADTVGRLITIDFDHGTFLLLNNGFTPNTYTDLASGAWLSRYTFSTNSPADIKLTGIKADYEQNLKAGRVSFGIKLLDVETDNTFEFFNHDVSDRPIYDDQRSNQFIYKEQILAAYAQYQLKIKKFDYQVGLRVEQTTSEGDLQSVANDTDKNIKRRYFDLFPSAGVNMQLNTSNSFGISYSRRIDRPRYHDLNPFENKIDELSYQKGNPFLKPQYTNVYELRHTYKYKLTTGLSFSDVKDFFAQVSDTIETKRTFIMQRNLASQKILSMNISYPFQITEWWSVYINLSVYHSRYRATFEKGKSINLDATVASFYQQQTFTLGKKWTAELSGFYNSPSVWAGTYKTKSIWTLDAGLQKRIWNDNASLKMSIADIFFTMPWSGTSSFGALNVVASGRWESRQLKINFSCRFGNKKMKSATNRKTGLDELNNRVN